MELNINGEVTYVRVLNLRTDQTTQISMHLASDLAWMRDANLIIQDPEYDAFLGSKDRMKNFSEEIVLPEVKPEPIPEPLKEEPKEEVKEEEQEEEFKPIEDIQEEVNTELTQTAPKKRGPKPKNKQLA